MPKEDHGFKVSDRRASSEDDSLENLSESPPQSGIEEGSLPALDFTTFVLSLSTSALMHLGELADKGGQPALVNLSLARQTIDLLAVLEQKTKGNLTGEEERLLSHILAELRLHYVQKLKG
ncbi:MAG: DUF1844 domain-containing protein [Myxococcales bacterium]|nr:DUF1844 domain-containing protein [Myxococcales bacterium]MCB9707350.1 DUF1844 domain-containing protein [Myxococcales bacterium]